MLPRPIAIAVAAHEPCTQRNNFHPLYTLYTPCNPVVLQGVLVLKCLLTEDVLLKIENTYRGSEMKIVTLLVLKFFLDSLYMNGHCPADR